MSRAVACRQVWVGNGKVECCGVLSSTVGQWRGGVVCRGVKWSLAGCVESGYSRVWFGNAFVSHGRVGLRIVIAGYCRVR